MIPPIADRAGEFFFYLPRRSQLDGAACSFYTHRL
jgi:hypothetical protein